MNIQPSCLIYTISSDTKYEYIKEKDNILFKTLLPISLPPCIYIKIS